MVFGMWLGLIVIVFGDLFRCSGFCLIAGWRVGADGFIVCVLLTLWVWVLGGWLVYLAWRGFILR